MQLQLYIMTTFLQYQYQAGHHRLQIYPLMCPVFLFCLFALSLILWEEWVNLEECFLASHPDLVNLHLSQNWSPLYLALLYQLRHKKIGDMKILMLQVITRNIQGVFIMILTFTIRLSFSFFPRCSLRGCYLSPLDIWCYLWWFRGGRYSITLIFAPPESSLMFWRNRRWWCICWFLIGWPTPSWRRWSLFCGI